jgi:hypothetical protein
VGIFLILKPDKVGCRKMASTSNQLVPEMAIDLTISHMAIENPQF